MIFKPTQKFQLFMIDGHEVLFSDSCISNEDRELLAQRGLFTYGARHDETGYMCQIRDHIMVDHLGDLISKTELPVKSDPKYPKLGSFWDVNEKEDVAWTPLYINLDQYLKGDYQSLFKFIHKS